jgi:hypothetical protein
MRLLVAWTLLSVPLSIVVGSMLRGLTHPTGMQPVGGRLSSPRLPA